MPEADAKDLFEILVREHADMLTVFLRSMVRDSTAVDDLFQETMLVAWRNLHRYDRERPFGPWLRGIAGKLVLAHRKKSARGMWLCSQDILEHLDHRLETVRAQTGDTFDEKIECLLRCIDELPEDYRSVVQLRYRQELPSDEVAGRLNIHMETLKKRTQRARARLLECVQRKLAWS